MRSPRKRASDPVNKACQPAILPEGNVGAIIDRPKGSNLFQGKLSGTFPRIRDIGNICDPVPRALTERPYII
jgi:hypothetical protein